MFTISEMSIEKDFEYWLESTYQGFKITYCEDNNATEEEAKKVFQEFYQKEKQAMDPANSNYTIFIAKSPEGKYTGILWLQIREDFNMIKGRIGWIVNIFVEPQYRKQGLASKFIELSEDWSRKQNLSTLAFHVASSNHVARNFYEKHNFELINTKENSCFYSKSIE